MDVFSIMLFDENESIRRGQDLIQKVEENIRLLKIEYQKTLKDYQKLKNGDERIYEELEPEFLQLLAKLKKAIADAENLWDRTIENVEELKKRKKEKAEFFITGVIWALSSTTIDEAQKKSLIEEAKKLIV